MEISHPFFNSIFLGATIIALVAFASMLFKKKEKHVFDPKDKHIYITGGSQGTGLSLAKNLARRGAHITIVARSLSKLQCAQTEIQSCITSPSQKIHYESADLTEAIPSTKALQSAEDKIGRKVDYIFLCAGGTQPGLFAESTHEQIKKEMDMQYFTAAYTAHAAVQSFLSHPTPSSCRLVFVSSICGLMGIPGYSAYCAGKYALRGLAEALRMELLLHGIKVHIFFPGTIYSPGYEEENKTKPEITKKIEDADEGITPDQAAEILVRGVEKGCYSIGCDFQGNLIRSLTKGAAPANNPIVDAAYALIAWIAMPIWRMGADKKVIQEGKRLQSSKSTNN